MVQVGDVGGEIGERRGEVHVLIVDRRGRIHEEPPLASSCSRLASVEGSRRISLAMRRWARACGCFDAA
jgi:hypothetical protein